MSKVNPENVQNQVLLHFILTIHYRFKKSIQLTKRNYPNFEIGQGVRMPIEILNHMTHVLQYALEFIKTNKNLKIHPPSKQIWESEIDRFESTLREIEEITKSNLISIEIQKIVLQGPLSDVMTHIGQLALISRMSGAPIPKENFMKAKIRF